MGGQLRNKAFTLIELLAIIVILAIIAVITVPIILGVIDNAKRGSVIDSAYGYKDAVDKYYITKLMEEDFELNGTYFISNGKLGEYEIPFSGNAPTSGKLVYQDGELISGTLVFDDYVALISENDITAKKGTFSLNVLSKEEQDNRVDGLYNSTLDEGRYIYRGQNPNNYIWLDENGDGAKEENELYRIISFESDGTTKVIRNNSIGDMPWDERTSEIEGPRKNTDNSYCNYNGEYNGCNAWGNQNNTYFEGNLLQDSFYYKYYSNNITTDLSQNVIDRTVITDSSLNTYLNGEWLNGVGFKYYVVEHEYNVGGPMYETNNISDDQGIIKEKYLENLSTWKGRVGLFNITEMVESSTNNRCSSVYSNYYNNPKYWYDANGDGTKTQNNSDWPCSNNNWLFKDITEWSLSPRSSSYGAVWGVGALGHFGAASAYSSKGIRPSFYLNSNVVLNGEGTEENPFIIEKF